MRKYKTYSSFCLAVLVALAAQGCRKEITPEDLKLYDIRIPNDERYGQLWGMKAIEAPTAWALQRDCSAITVAVVDTGIDWRHPDMNQNFFTDGTTGLPGKDVRVGMSSPFDPLDDNLHGTHVAGTIGALGDNSIGVTGVCWKARLMAVKVLDSTGSGTNSDVAAGITYAITNNAKIINMSLGGGSYSGAMDAAMANARTAGLLVVTAAGNSGDNNDVTSFYPSSYGYDNQITVAAVDKTDHLADFTNYGPTTVHIAAPGVDILSTFPTAVTAEMAALGKTSKYEMLQGTSMASPHVAGAAALIWAYHPTYTYIQVKNKLLGNAAFNPHEIGWIAEARRLRLGPTI